MSRSIESQLNESFRDALVAYYLGEVVPNSPLLIGLGLHQRLKTANDLYEFFLIDNQVTHDVETSYVASAIASVQQYINGALMGMEPGYDLLQPTEARFVEWRDRSSQYPIWAANMQLALYPETFISPALRLKKSGYFAQLENDINQNKINIDTTQEAVKSYLASFEEVANLTVINGYIDSDRFAEGKYYFIGKSRAESIYYWRMVDMNERAYKAGTEGPKYDNPTPGAWSDWKRAEIGVNANTLERTIRPVFFNNRLFMSWVDLIHVAGEPTITGSAEAPEVVNTEQVKLVFNLSYKKYDDSWSAPQIYMDVTTHKNVILAGTAMDLHKELNTIVAFDVSSSPESLFIGMYAGEQSVPDEANPTKANYAFLATTYIDKNFNISPLYPSDHKIEGANNSAMQDDLRVQSICWTFAIKNKNNLQFTWFPSQTKTMTIQNIITTAPHPESDDYNYRNLQENILDISENNSAITLNRERSTIEIRTGIHNNIQNSTDSTYDIRIWATNNVDLTFHLIPVRDASANPYITLAEGSYLLISSMPTRPPAASFAAHTPIIHYLISDSGMDDLTFPENWEPHTQYSIALKTLNKEFADLIRRHEIYTDSGSMYPKTEIPSYPYSMTVTATSTPLETHKYSQQILLPYDMNKATTTTLLPLSQSQPLPQLIAPSPLTGQLTYNKDDLSLAHSYIPNADLSTRYFILHGVEIRSDNTVIGKALKLTQFELHFQDSVVSDIVSPKINTKVDANLGIAEYIDFSGSNISFSDGSTTEKRKPIRMNTLFARELINKANIALEALLSWNTQQLQEPPIGDETEPTEMDFKGANGLYFWELFLHLPFMISHRLNLEQRFKDAEFWLGFIFDPGRKAHDSAPAYWNVRPLTELPDPDYFMRAPIDPDGIAASDPIKYQKAVYFHYIKNLVDRGDMAYRQLTPDSLGEAKLWYVRILDLLGPRPDVMLTSQWAPIALAELAESTNPGLREFEMQLIEQEQQLRSTEPANSHTSLLRLSTFASDPTLAEEDNAHFITPMNAELTKYWDMLESRLYNLRHNLTLDGKPLSLPLFAAPLDPRALLAAYANGATEGGAGSLLAQEIPHYRYAVMFARASTAVDNLIQFGSTLLSIIERKEQGQLMELQQQQVWEFAQYAIDLQLEAQKVETEARKALQASQVVTDARAGFYGRLAEENVSKGETSANREHLIARISDGVGATANALASALKVLPNHGGFHAGAIGGTSNGAAAGGAVGGSRFEGMPEVVAVAAYANATLHGAIGDALERSEIYRRRLQEWENARDQARLESEHITAQLAVHDAQTRVTALQLRQAQEAKKQAETVHAFLNKRFTNSQLYQWLNGQFSTFYYQAYDATFSLCLAAQACWQYEIADYSTTFIQPAAWKDAWRGLTAGEALKLNLLRMDAAYLARHDRKLEIVKTVSVKQLPVFTDTEPSINPGWDVVVARLAEEGIAEFEITRTMLDADYPGHYLRRVKRISVSLPVTVGPYQDIRATLTQTYSAVQMNGPEGPLKENMRASQQIAVSTGVDDDGLFVFNFDDERYLPFEGTGAISRWALTFSAGQEEMIASITDIIVHVRYTAKSS
ncbi:toxin [Pseudomonas syringae]|uniref:Toxin n=1 Tax=Pseudomonas syringae TaxID=317 RepID=A0A1C7Z345_PSESX|nr:neuraminidase-like domain-containing protein [Pseudomonas syringae]OCR23580.1 toxin [Pseudomonas syringae]